MGTDSWVGLLTGLLLTAAVLSLVWLSDRPDRPVKLQSRRFVCPVLGRSVACSILQDVRTGQWRRVERCSALAEPETIRCGEDCRKQLNLGFPLLERPA